ncbi:MAG: sporulation protein YqfD [bacterium]|nr:sporulation protein YqfD [bacterium]
MKSYLLIEVTGKNINNYIERIIKKKINIYFSKIINNKTAYLKIEYSDYPRLLKYKSTYKLKILNYYGLIKTKRIFNKNKILFLLIIFAVIFITILSNVILKVEVIHSNKEIRLLLTQELNNYGIKKYSFKKTYQQLETIEEKIVSNNPNQIEWLEIINKGTKYIVKVEERKVNPTKEEIKYQNIIAKKNAIITGIIANHGVVLKNKNDYVNKGDVIISGYVTLPDGSSAKTYSSGKVYGEVWYTVEVTQPLVYREEKLTGKTKEVYIINFLNKRISIFDFKKYESFQTNKKNLLSSFILPINLLKEQQYELNVIDEVYTKEEAIMIAKEKAQTKLKTMFEENITIKSEQILNIKLDVDKVTTKIFYSIIEEIGEIQPIQEN